MTPSEVYTLVRRQCDESDTTFWGEDETYQLMSVGEGIIAQKIGLIQSTYTVTTVTGTRGYTAPVGTVVRMTWDEVKLNKIDINKIDEYEGEAYGGITSQGYPVRYYQFGNSVYLSPIPDSDKTLKSYYYGYPATLTSASSAFSIPEEYGQLTADYALWRMFIKDQQMTHEALAFKEAWESGLKTVLMDWSRRKYYNMGAVVNEADPIETCE